MGGVMLHDVAKSLFFTRFCTAFWYRLGSLRRHQDQSKRAEGSSEKLREAQKSSEKLMEAQGSSGMLRCTHAPTQECMPACPHARTDACTQARKHSQTHACTPATSLKHIRQPLNAQKKHKNTQFQLGKISVSALPSQVCIYVVGARWPETPSTQKGVSGGRHPGALPKREFQVVRTWVGVGGG